MNWEPRDVADDLAAMVTDRKSTPDQADIAQRALNEIQELRAFRDNWEGRQAPRLRRRRR